MTQRGIVKDGAFRPVSEASQPPLPQPKGIASSRVASRPGSHTR